MRRRHRAWVLRRLALGPAAFVRFRDSAEAVAGSRRVGSTRTPVGAGGALLLAPLAAWAALPARRPSAPAAA